MFTFPYVKRESNTAIESASHFNVQAENTLDDLLTSSVVPNKVSLYAVR